MSVRNILPAIRDFKIFAHGRLLDLKRFEFITLWKQTPCTLFVSCTANGTLVSAQSATGCQGLSGSRFWFSPATSTCRTGREIPSFFILAIRVVRFSPSRRRRHWGPPTIHPAACNATQDQGSCRILERFLRGAMTGVVDRPGSSDPISAMDSEALRCPSGSPLVRSSSEVLARSPAKNTR